MFSLSICEGTVLRHLSFEDRVRTIAQAGFSVDLGVWPPTELDAMAHANRRSDKRHARVASGQHGAPRRSCAILAGCRGLLAGS